MRRSQYKGVILAAGKGQRLLPLTAQRPKPLIPFAGVPLLYLALWRLQEAGIAHVLINAHYQWEKVVTAVAAKPSVLTQHLELSLEKKQLLGTGGAFARLNSLRAGADLVVLNGDIVTDLCLRDLMACHESQGNVATMALRPSPLPQETKIWCFEQQVLAIGGDKPPRPQATAHGFACAQVLSDHFLRGIKEEKEISIIDFYQQALGRGERVGAWVSSGFWFDLGTPASYFQAHVALLDWWQNDPALANAAKENAANRHQTDRLGLHALLTASGKGLDFIPQGQTYHQGGAKVFGPSLIPTALQLPASSKVGPYVVLDQGVQVLAPLTTSHCLLLDQAVITQAVTLTQMIVTAEGVLPLS